MLKCLSFASHFVFPIRFSQSVESPQIDLGPRRSQVSILYDVGRTANDYAK